MSIESDDFLEECPAWAVTYSSLDEQDVCIAIRYRHQLFCIEVFANDLEGWSEKGQLLQLFQDAMEDNDAEELLYDVIWERFQPFIGMQTIPTMSKPTSLSLQDFFGVNVLPFKLVYGGKDVHFIQTSVSSTLLSKLLPQIKLCDIVHASKVPHIDASKIQIKPYFSEDSDITSDAPVKVSLQDSSSLYYFKAVGDHASFVREFEILHQLTKHRLNGNFRLPVLYSLVIYSTSPTTAMGLLLHYINHDGSMADWITGRNPSRQLREKWYHQIADTVRALHRCDIVWGDVKPENVLIDHDQNAWIIDFGGGFSPDFVDEMAIETADGDDQGVSRIREMLLDG